MTGDWMWSRMWCGRAVASHDCLRMGRKAVSCGDRRYLVAGWNRGRTVSITTILIVILIVILLGGVSTGFDARANGAVGVVLAVVLILWLLGKV